MDIASPRMIEIVAPSGQYHIYEME